LVQLEIVPILNMTRSLIISVLGNYQYNTKKSSGLSPIGVSIKPVTKVIKTPIDNVRLTIENFGPY
jgi:hypothetical protein